MSAVIAVSLSLAGATADESIRLKDRMQRFVDQQTLSGAVTLVAQHGKIIGQNAVGLADIDTNRPMAPNTLFWIASMTKPITATALMILQDEGRLSVDDPVGKYLPEFNAMKLADGKPPERAVTIAHLLTHTSGVANPATEDLGENPMLPTMATAIAKQPLQFEPGTQWKYGAGLTAA